jgi:hypothetical protein
MYPILEMYVSNFYLYLSEKKKRVEKIIALWGSNFLAPSFFPFHLSTSLLLVKEEKIFRCLLEKWRSNRRSTQWRTRSAG